MIARKDLACTAQATAFQKAFGAQLRERVVERESLRHRAGRHAARDLPAMDIRLFPPWWSAYISANASAAATSNHGQAWAFRRTVQLLLSGTGLTLANDPATAPWAHAPPHVLVARLTCDCSPAGFTQWAAALDCEFFPIEAPAWGGNLARLVSSLARR